jgi:hypothetical protein
MFWTGFEILKLILGSILSNNHTTSHSSSKNRIVPSIKFTQLQYYTHKKTRVSYWELSYKIENYHSLCLHDQPPGSTYKPGEKLYNIENVKVYLALGSGNNNGTRKKISTRPQDQETHYVLRSLNSR